MYWLLCRLSALTIENTLFLYKAVAFSFEALDLSQTAILQRFQGKPLRTFLDAPFYINTVIHNGLQMETVKEVIRAYTT